MKKSLIVIIGVAIVLAIILGYHLATHTPEIKHRHQLAHVFSCTAGKPWSFALTSAAYAAIDIQKIEKNGKFEDVYFTLKSVNDGTLSFVASFDTDRGIYTGIFEQKTWSFVYIY